MTQPMQVRPLEYSSLPVSLRPAIRYYIEDKVKPEGFILAVLENDLCKACQLADWVNLHSLPIIVAWVYENLPATIWGSREKVAKWVNETGVNVPNPNEEGSQ